MSSALSDIIISSSIGVILFIISRIFIASRAGARDVSVCPSLHPRGRSAPGAHHLAGCDAAGAAGGARGGERGVRGAMPTPARRERRRRMTAATGRKATPTPSTPSTPTPHLPALPPPASPRPTRRRGAPGGGEGGRRSRRGGPCIDSLSLFFCLFPTPPLLPPPLSRKPR